MQENVANPLHCPVRLYEFYLSRWYDTLTLTHTHKVELDAVQTCLPQQIKQNFFSVLLFANSPETVKKRTDMFYLQPERNVHTHRSDSVPENFSL